MIRVWMLAAIAWGMLAGSGLAQESAGPDEPEMTEAIPAATSGPPTVRELYVRPALESVDISPSGRYLSYVITDGVRGHLYVKDLRGEQQQTVLAFGPGEFVRTTFRWAVWKSGDRLVVSSVEAGRRAKGSLVIHRFDGSPPQAIDLDHRAFPTVVSRLPGSHDELLLQLESWEPGLHGDIVKVDLREGHVGLVQDNNNAVGGYFADAAGEIRGRIRYLGHRGRGGAVIERRDEASSRWVVVANLRDAVLRDMPDYEVLAPAGEPNLFYAMKRPEAGEGDTAAVHVLDFSNGVIGPPVWRNPRYDVSDVITHPATGDLLAGCYWDDIYRCDFEDPDLQAQFNGLYRFFDEERSLSVVGQSDDAGRWVLKASGPDEPGSYYLYDATTRQVDLIGNAYPILPPDRLGVMRRFDYRARDGQALSGYVTALPGVARRGLIVLPHGGPERRDTFRYDPWVQFLATRGFTVFQPNFRGSSGFGRAFAESGYHQWGRRMQDDVTDGVEALIGEGQAERGRICIMGGSYGGYVALWAGASQPDLYACVISLAGVSDPLAIQQWERDNFGEDSERFQYWAKALGHPDEDRDALLAVSPIAHLEHWRAPVLLIHGDQDDVVPIAQSTHMETALREAGKTVEMLTLVHAGHTLRARLHQEQMLTRVEAFLDQVLPADGATVPQTAQAGSAETEAVRAVPASPS